MESNVFAEIWDFTDLFVIVERQWQSVGTQLQIIDRLPKTTAALSLPVPIASRNWNSIETMCFRTFPQIQIQVSANTLPTSDDFRKYQMRSGVLGRLTDMSRHVFSECQSYHGLLRFTSSHSNEWLYFLGNVTFPTISPNSPKFHRCLGIPLLKISPFFRKIFLACEPKHVWAH